jgi:hypothetical protein
MFQKKWEAWGGEGRMREKEKMVVGEGIKGGGKERRKQRKEREDSPL